MSASTTETLKYPYIGKNEKPSSILQKNRTEAMKKVCFIGHKDCRATINRLLESNRNYSLKPAMTHPLRKLKHPGQNWPA